MLHDSVFIDPESEVIRLKETKLSFLSIRETCWFGCYYFRFVSLFWKKKKTKALASDADTGRGVGGVAPVGAVVEINHSWTLHTRVGLVQSDSDSLSHSSVNLGKVVLSQVELKHININDPSASNVFRHRKIGSYRNKTQSTAGSVGLVEDLLSFTRAIALCELNCPDAVGATLGDDRWAGGRRALRGVLTSETLIVGEEREDEEDQYAAGERNEATAGVRRSHRGVVVVHQVVVFCCELVVLFRSTISWYL